MKLFADRNSQNSVYFNFRSNSIILQIHIFLITDKLHCIYIKISIHLIAIRYNKFIILNDKMNL